MYKAREVHREHGCHTDAEQAQTAARAPLHYSNNPNDRKRPERSTSVVDLVSEDSTQADDISIPFDIETLPVQERQDY